MPNGNKTDNGVLEIGTDEIVSSFKEDTPGENVKEYLAQARLANEEKKSERKKNFSQVFDNPLKGFPYNEEIEVTPIKEGNMQVEGDPYVPQKKGVNKNIANYWNKEIKGLTPKELEAIQSMYMITDHSGVVQMYKAGKRDFIKSIKEEVVLEDYKKVIKMYPRDNDWKKLITKHKRAIDDFRKNNKDLPSKVEDELLGWASQTGEVGGKDDAEDFIMSILDESTISEAMKIKDIFKKHKRELTKAYKTGDLSFSGSAGKKAEYDLTTWAMDNNEIKTDDPDEFFDWLSRDLEDIVKGKIREETITEAKNLMPEVQKIVDTKGAAKVGGVMLDMFTASVLTQAYAKVSDANKKKMESSNIQTLVNLAQKVMGMKEELQLEEAHPCKGLSEDDPCWKDYKQVGMKKKNGKEVPNCVPKEDVEEGAMDGQKMTGQEISTYFRKNPIRDKDLKKAVEIALDHSGAMNYAIKQIEKLKKGLSKKTEVKKALQFANEEVKYKLNVGVVFTEDKKESVTESKDEPLAKMFKTTNKTALAGIMKMLDMTDVKVIQAMQKQNPKGFMKTVMQLGEDVMGKDPLKGFPFQKKFSIESTFREMFETDLQEETIVYKVKGIQKPETDKFNQSAKMMKLKISFKKQGSDTHVTMTGNKKQLRDFDSVARGKSSYGDPSTITHFDEK